jgi:hypothetical protein
MDNAKMSRGRALALAGTGGVMAALGLRQGVVEAAAPSDIVGTWLAAVRLSSGPGYPAHFRALYSFMPGGCLVETDNSEHAPPPPLSGSGQGVWAAEGAGYRFKMIKQLYDAKGLAAGYIRITGPIVMRGPNTASTRGTYDFFDTTGKHLGGGTYEQASVRMTL